MGDPPRARRTRPWSRGGPHRALAGVAVFKGSFDVAQAERLLWRAGFGPRRGEAEALARLGLDGAVHALTFPGDEAFVGPAPKDEKGRQLAPYDAWGHDHLWWLDRMVRTSRPLVERMALVWHDWFATSNSGVDSQHLMLNQNQLFREHGLGSFPELLLDVTRDPAMLLWLNGSDNSKFSPNENYAREMMELFTLGAGRGYGEQDVRQNARALTGFRNDWKNGAGNVNFRYDSGYHDPGTKAIFGKRGAWSWKDSCRLCVTHPDHPSFFVDKLWSYFIPTAPDAATQRALQQVYVGGGRKIRPLVTAILKHPSLHEGPRMVKSPTVFNAGLLRRLGRGSDSLLAFQRDLEARGLADRVLVHVWSEFGRRAQENGSGGTDHGAAGIGFLLGTRVRGTMVGEFPGLKTGLDQNGNLTATSDFRGVYAALLEQWLGTDASVVLPGIDAFARPGLVR